jgi:hydroxymethylpyrimidine/phosphomethylpyrimidine kinase
MLASAEIIGVVAETWRAEGLAGTVPLVVDPVCASMHGDPLLHPSALNSVRTELFPLATLVTPNLDEVRLITGIDVVDTATQQDAAAPCTIWVRSGHWSRVGTCAPRAEPRPVVRTVRSSTSSPCRGGHRPRPRRR